MSQFHHIISAPGGSGFKQTAFDAQETAEPITVEVGTLDSVVTGPVHLLKVDVEGAELHELRGAFAFAAKVRAR